MSFALAVSTKENKMKAKKRTTRNEHGPKAKTPAGRSVFRDLFPAEEAAEVEIRSTLLRGLEHWLASSGMTQAKAAEVLGITQARAENMGTELFLGGNGVDVDPRGRSENKS